MFDSYLEEMQVVFSHLNYLKNNKIQISELVEAITKLGKKSTAVKVPSGIEV